MMHAIRRSLLLMVLLALPVFALAQEFGFKPPPDPDDAKAGDVMRDLAQRIVPVYKDPDNVVFLATVSAPQIVSGAYTAAFDSSKAMRRLRGGRPFDGLMARTLYDGLYARARDIETKDRVPFAQAFMRAFQELVPPMDNVQAEALLKLLEVPPAVYREPVRLAFDRWRTRGALPQADAIALVRTWHEYESRRSFAPFLTELLAAETKARYAVADDVEILLPGDVAVIHARVVRPGRSKGKLPALLRVTLDPAEDDAQRSAVRDYVGVTAYVRGRKPDGSGAVVPFVNDGADAAAVIDWIAQQPWSDGRVAMIGDGYSGYTAWAAARTKPPALKAIATVNPMAPGIDFPKSGQIYRNAMVRWVQERTRGTPPRNETAAEADARWRAQDAYWYAGDFPYWIIDGALIDDFSPLVRLWLTHQSHDPYWQQLLPTAQQFAQIDIPVLTIGGYYGAEVGALYYYRAHRTHRPQAESTLVLGPWDETSIAQGTAPTLDGYTLDTVARVDVPDLRYQWLDHTLKGAHHPALLKDRVNYQVMGANTWRHAAALDDAGHAPLRLYMDTRKSDGPHRLLASPAASGGQAQLSVNMADRRDANVPWSDAVQTKQLPTRNSIAFVSDPLTKDTDIEGSLRASFDFTPSRADVDFNVALYEQTAAGDYVLLFKPYDFRASYAANPSKRRLLRAGVRQTLAFTAERVTARKLSAGSRVVLVVGINKRPDRQINFGSGKDVNSESTVDAQPAMSVRWHAQSHVEIRTANP